MSLLRRAVQGLVGVAVAGAVNRATGQRAVHRSPVGRILDAVGQGSRARHVAGHPRRRGVGSLVAGAVASALVSRMFSGRRRR